MARLEELLAALEWAGFDLPQEWDSDFDEQNGAQLFAVMWRGDGGVGRGASNTTPTGACWPCSPSMT